MSGPWLPQLRVAASVLAVWIWRRKRRTALLDINVSERTEDAGVERARYGALTQGLLRGVGTGGE